MKPPFDHQTIRFRICAGAGALAVLATTPARAQSPSPQCVQIYGVMSKLYDAPFHMYLIDSAATDARLHGGKPTVGESIFVGGATYVSAGGKWMKSPIDVAAMRKESQDNMSTTKATCAHVRDETLNGESTAMWSIHSVTENGATDSNVWVSKSRNVIVQSDSHLDVGGALGKSHTIQRFEYTNVHAPAGTK